MLGKIAAGGIARRKANEETFIEEGIRMLCDELINQFDFIRNLDFFKNMLYVSCHGSFGNK